MLPQPSVPLCAVRVAAWWGELCAGYLGAPHTGCLPAHGQVPCSMPGTSCCFLARVLHKWNCCELCSALRLHAGQTGRRMAVLLSLAGGMALASGIFRTAFCAGEDRASSHSWHAIHQEASQITPMPRCRDQAAQQSCAWTVFSLNPPCSSLPCYLSIYLGDAKVKYIGL